MQPSDDGLVPVDSFVERAMAPLPSFNDASPGTGMFGPWAIGQCQSMTLARAD